MHTSPAEDCSHSASSFGRMQVRRGLIILKTSEGVYSDGKVDLTEIPKDVRDETRVLVTCLEPQALDLRVRGIDEAHAAELRARLTRVRRGLGLSRDGRVRRLRGCQSPFRNAVL